MKLSDKDYTIRAKARFFEKVEKTDTCWLWTAGIRHYYGGFKFKGKMIDAHRMSYMIHYGEIPDGMFVLHKCDNYKCVNPEHLFLGTHSDNMKDAYKKGRIDSLQPRPFSKENPPPNLKRSPEEIIKIKEAVANRGSKSMYKLSKELSVDIKTLYRVKNGEMYKDY